MEATPLEIVASVVFAVAVLHTFLTKYFERLAHVYPRHAGLLHLLGEVEVVFGFWALVLMLLMAWMDGKQSAIHYLEGRNFTEPLFVFVIMVVAASRPIMLLVQSAILHMSRWLPFSPRLTLTFLILFLIPLLGSFITEPAAMTIAALLLGRQFYALRPSPRLAYATLGLLFVNISVGGTLTHFAAPPVIMVAQAWNWGLAHMFTEFGWRAALGIAGSTLAYYAAFRRELATLAAAALPPAARGRAPVPAWITAVQVAFLAFTVWQAHHPALFIGGFLFYLAFAQATAHHQSPLDLRPPVLVGFFLAGLVVQIGRAHV